MSDGKTKSSGPKGGGSQTGPAALNFHSMATRSQGPAEERELPKRERPLPTPRASRSQPPSTTSKTSSSSGSSNIPPLGSTPVKPLGRRTQASHSDAMDSPAAAPQTPAGRIRRAAFSSASIQSPIRGIKTEQIDENAVEDSSDEDAGEVEKMKGKAKKGAAAAAPQTPSGRRRRAAFSSTSIPTPIRGIKKEQMDEEAVEDSSDEDTGEVEKKKGKGRKGAATG